MPASIYISSPGTNQFIERSLPGMHYVDALDTINVPGLATLNRPSIIKQNSTDLFIWDDYYSYLYDVLATDLSTIQRIDLSSGYWLAGKFGVDDNYIYIPDFFDYGRLVRLSIGPPSAYVDEITGYTFESTPYDFSSNDIGPACSDGTYIYISVGWDGWNDYRIAKIAISDLGSDFPNATVSDIFVGYYFQDIAISGGYVYLVDNNYNKVIRLDQSTLATIDSTDISDKPLGPTLATVTGFPSINRGFVYAFQNFDITGTFDIGDSITFVGSGATAVVTDNANLPYELDFDSVSGIPLITDSINNETQSGTISAFDELDLLVNTSFDVVGGGLTLDTPLTLETPSGLLFGYINSFDNVTADSPALIWFYLYTGSLASFPASGDTLSLYNRPNNLTSVDAASSVYVADPGNDSVYVLNSSTLAYENEISDYPANDPDSILLRDNVIYATCSLAGYIRKDDALTLTNIPPNIATLEGSLVSTAIQDPGAICNDGTYLYFINSVLDPQNEQSNQVLYKFRLPALGETINSVSYEAAYGFSITESIYPDMVTDRTHLYFVYAIVEGYDGIGKKKCSDLTWASPDRIAVPFNGSDSFHGIRGLTLFNGKIYVLDQITEINSRIIVFDSNTLAYITEYALPGTANTLKMGIDNDGTYIFVTAAPNFVLA
jgi:hypothetical protein